MRQLITNAMVVLLLVTVSACKPQPVAQPLTVGHTVPLVELPSATSGDRVSIDSLKGQVVVLNFWSTSCSVCLQEIDDLNAIQRSGKAMVVGIALDEDQQRVRSVMEKRAIAYQVLLGDQETFEQFDGVGIPYTLVLDRSHIVRKRYFGRMTEDDLDSVLQSIQDSKSLAMREK